MPRYWAEVRHQELGKYRYISGSIQSVVEAKAASQVATWEDQWRMRQAAENRAVLVEHRKTLAQARTAEAMQAINEIKEILRTSLKSRTGVDWLSLKQREPFYEPAPTSPQPPQIPDEPRPFAPRINWLDRLYPPRKSRKITDAARQHGLALEEWSTRKALWEQEYEKNLKDYEMTFLEWKNRKEIYQNRLAEQHKTIDEISQNYRDRLPKGIEQYCDLLLSTTKFGDSSPEEHEVSFLSGSGILVVDYRLPSTSDIPKLKQVRYVISKGEYQEIYHKQSELNILYDDFCYQICLKTIHQLYDSDEAEALKAIVFNGWVEFPDPGTGRRTRSCIMSVQAEREAFLDINLANVDPKACFRTLKGVGAAKLHGLAAVPPLLRIERTDKRFVESREVVDDLYEGTNLAAIGWEDFEHLIREIFAKEFSREGGEVKVTRASRDGGVDAVAFDPDPLRGGKIVIQAKRYTNTVDVSAVRDLYGTVLNEGATKGILVTTSAFGHDSYAFAKDKPLTLLDGGNLLHLLARHGHRARIDLAEAKHLNVAPLARSTTRLLREDG